MNEKKLKDILKMSLKLTDQEEATFASTEMDEERKKWLQAAINKTLEDDESNKIVLFTQLFVSYHGDKSYDEEKIEELENIFDQLNYLVEGFDIGIIFNSNGGTKHCLDFLQKSPHTSLRIEAANLIGNSTHNNPSVQSVIIENKGMELFLKIIKTSPEEQLVIKCLYALSTLIGGNEQAEKLFGQLEDSQFFIRMLNLSNEKIKIKTAFLLMKITNSEHDSIPITRFITKNLIKMVLQLLEDKYSTWQIHLIHLLVPCFTKLKPDQLLTKEEKAKTLESFQKRLEQHEKEDKEVFENEIIALNSLISLLK